MTAQPIRRSACLPAPADALKGTEDRGPTPAFPARKTQELLRIKDSLTQLMGWHAHFERRMGSFVGSHFGSMIADIHAELVEEAALAGLPMSDAAEAMRRTLLDERQGPRLSPQIRGLAALLLYGAREMHREAQALAGALAQHPAMCALPPQEAWRLCVDHAAVGDARHAELRFDNEPGYMAGMYRALAQMVWQDVQKVDLDARSIVDLHHTAVHGVFARSTLEHGLARCGAGTLRAIGELTAPDAKFPEALQADGAMDPLHGAAPGQQGIQQMRKGLRGPNETTTVYLTVGGNASEAGLEELKAKGEAWCRVSREVVMGRGRLASTRGLRTQPKTAAELMGRITACLDACRKASAAADGDPDLTLRAIAVCCQDLQQLHPFPDGNARTIGVLVLNKLLLERGLPPAALADANRLDAYSVEEVMREIRAGQERFAQIARNTSAPAV